MSDVMRPASMTKLLESAAGEYRENRSVFGIPESRFFRKRTPRTMDFFGTPCAMPLGPAAGPHTQLAGNIAAAYLTGGRFFELKTVQKLDTLDIGKPCIDARDEAYNTEWSAELKVEESYAEFAKGWILLHLLEGSLGLSAPESGTAPGGSSSPFVFNMSVGYDLEGIKTPKMDSFIEGTAGRASKLSIAPLLDEAGEWLSQSDTSLFKEASIEGISEKICNSVTLSTMHGCPPEDIEKIARYLIEEKGLNTYVKLNPTLLGYEEVRKILDTLGFSYISIREETFTHDLLYPDAKEMLGRLTAVAAERRLAFGVKLTNTLPSVNTGDFLPDKEMYMSGRALYPISISLAARLAADFGGKLPLSFCAGIGAHNAAEVLAAGIRPLTMATELLRPGGYYRLCGAAEKLEAMDTWPEGKPGGVDVEALSALAEKALHAPYSRKSYRGYDRVRVPGPLGLTDCFVAPCVEACPIHQDVPEYIRLNGTGDFTRSIEVILDKNPLPAVTGHICDHQCMYVCTRLDYEGAVRIREMKRIAEERGLRSGPPEARSGGAAGKAPKVAIIGAGPAGLSAAFFLARAGIAVTVFEKESSAGGIVSTILPRFRIPREALERDIEYIRCAGVEFRFGAGDVDPSFLKEEGFETTIVAVGAGRSSRLELPGGNPKVIPSLEFLADFNLALDTAEGISDPGAPAYRGPDLGRHVAVVGGGNTAMDSSRAAGKLPGVEKVTVLYRRTEGEMPADREEYGEALAEGIEFLFLRSPVGFDPDGTLTVEIMELGEYDDTGRRKPVPTGRSEELTADTVITAIGERPDPEVLSRFGIPAAESPMEAAPGVYLIGDARTGPSTVAECIAEGRGAADAVLWAAAAEGARGVVSGTPAGNPVLADVLARRTEAVPGTASFEDGDEVRAAKLESRRCLECAFFCGKCVEVCPNRANLALPFPGFDDEYQIIHLDGACNECGNCDTFCPWDGKPYTDKFTIFSSPEDFEDSGNSGIAAAGDEYRVRCGKGEYRWPAAAPLPDARVELMVRELTRRYRFLL